MDKKILPRAPGRAADAAHPSRKKRAADEPPRRKKNATAETPGKDTPPHPRRQKAVDKKARGSSLKKSSKISAGTENRKISPQKTKKTFQAASAETPAKKRTRGSRDTSEKVTTKAKKLPEKPKEKVSVRPSTLSKTKKRDSRAISEPSGKRPSPAKSRRAAVPAAVKGTRRRRAPARPRKRPDIAEQARPSQTLPEEYGENDLLVLPVDPDIVFASWEIRKDHIPTKSGLVLRIFDVTGVDSDKLFEKSGVLDLLIDRRVGSGFFDIKLYGRELIAAIGLVDAQGTYTPVMFSRRISVPPLLLRSKSGLPGQPPKAGSPVGY